MSVNPAVPGLPVRELEDVLRRYEPVIGIEVHVELQTRSKIFCGCSTEFGAPPNTNICPVCIGLPGVLPVLNERVVEYALRAALALECRITPVSQFARKNYFYPDLPKGFQITQYEQSLAYDGRLDVEVGQGTRPVRIARVNIEEEAAKSLHVDGGDGGGYSLIDFNRSGVALIEIVSEPDLRSAGEARAYLGQLRNLILYTGISDCKMQEGSFRFDVNVSLRPVGSGEYGNLVELKNLNSFRAAGRAIEYEVRRQAALLDAGQRVVRETRGWDEAHGRTLSQRSKEESNDYRYFPEPDLVLLRIDDGWRERVRAEMPLLPAQHRQRLIAAYDLSDYLAGVLVADAAALDFFDRTVAELAGTGRGAVPETHAGQAVANWVTGDLARLANAAGAGFDGLPIEPSHLADLLRLVAAGTVSGKMAKELMDEVWATGRLASVIAAERGLAQVSDTAALAAAVEAVLAGNPAVVADYLAGKERVFGFLVGQVMKETRGRANPELANSLVREALARRA